MAKKLMTPIMKKPSAIKVSQPKVEQMKLQAMKLAKGHKQTNLSVAMKSFKKAGK